MSEIETRVREHLDALGVQYEALACDPELADTAKFCERYGVALEDSANAIVVVSKRPKGQHACCILLATTRLDVNRAVCAAMGVKRASFADADQTRELTGMLIGGVTPFGLAQPLPILIDAAVLQRQSVVVGGGSRSLKIRLPPDALTRLPDARVVEGLAHGTQ